MEARSTVFESGEGEGVVHASAEYTANQHIFATTSFRDLITGKF